VQREGLLTRTCCRGRRLESRCVWQEQWHSTLRRTHWRSTSTCSHAIPTHQRTSSPASPAAAVMAAKGRIAAATYRITAAHAGYPLYSTMRRQIPSPKVVLSFTEWNAPMTYSERGWWGLNPRPVTCPTNFISPCNLAYTSSLQSRTMLLALLCIINGQARILPRYDRTREAILTCAQKLT